MIDVEELLQSSDAILADGYRSHAGDLIRFATVVVGRDAASDVVSSAVLRVLGRDVSSISNLRAYLFSAVANEGRNLKRSEARRRTREATAAGSADWNVRTPESFPEVREAVERLSARQRAVIYLAYWEDLPEQSIAEHLGIGVGSVRRHLGRARKNLRRKLGHESS
jgi:RNA polymerase sigma-70 factor (ECF subfamily)